MSNTTNENKFVYGVLDKFELKNSATDVAVVGRVKGTLKRGDKIFITNYGDDDDELVVSSVVALEIEGKEATEATDCFVAVRIRDGLSENIKPGSVIHSENASEEEIHIAYVTAIGDSYVGRRDLEIYETELSIMSITDCAESWRIFIKLHERRYLTFFGQKDPCCGRNICRNQQAYRRALYVFQNKQIQRRLCLFTP